MSGNHDKNSLIQTIPGSKFILLTIVSVSLLVDSAAVNGQLNLEALRKGGRPSATDEPGNPDSLSGDLGEKKDTPRATSTAIFGSAPFDLDLIAPLFATPESVADAESGPVLNHEAEKSYLAGDQAMALRLMFAHMAAEYDDAQASLRAVKYSRLLRRPVWNVRFGVSMWIRDGGIGDSDSAPIPSKGGATGGGNRAVGRNLFAGALQGRKSAGGRKPARGKVDRGSLLADALKGNRGSLLAGALKGKRVSGKLNDDDSGAQSIAGSESAQDNDKSDGTGSSVAGTPSSDDSRMRGDEVDSELDDNLGLVAEVVGEEFETRYRRGDFGSLLSSIVAATQSKQVVTAPAAGLGPLRPNPVKSESTQTPSAALLSSDSLPTWKPGIVHVGTGANKEVIQRARDANIDILIHFEVVLKTGRTDTVQNVSRCRLINVATGKSIGVSKSMDNLEEQKLAAKGNGGREYVLQRIENLLSVLDRDVAVINLPKLNSEVARRRLGSLLSSGPRRSLRTLAEIRLYQMQNLLTDEEVETAFDIVGGIDSLLFIYGSTVERAEMARTWATDSPGKVRDES